MQSVALLLSLLCFTADAMNSSRLLGDVQPQSFHQNTQESRQLQSHQPQSNLQSLQQNTQQGHQNIAPEYKEIDNENFYYYGELDGSGKRSGNGISLGKVSTSVYLGRWCNNLKDGYGVSVNLRGISFSQPSSAKAQIWREGAVLGDARWIDGLQDRVEAALHSKNPMRKLKCLLSSLPASGAACKSQAPAASLNSRIPWSPEAEATKEFGQKIIATLRNALFVPFKPAFSGQARALLFSLQQNYRPAGQLYEQDGNVFKLVGSGCAIEHTFDSRKVYVFEAGMTQTAAEPAFAASLAQGSFAVVLAGKGSGWSKVAGKTLTQRQSNGWSYSVALGGDFTQQAGPTYLVGRFSSQHAPWYNAAAKSLTYYYLGGADCNGKKRGGELILACAESAVASGIEIRSFSEPSTCFYQAHAATSELSSLVHWLAA